MALAQDIEGVKTDINGALKVGSDQVALSQKELLLFGMLRLILGSETGSIQPTLLRTPVNISASGDNTIVAAVASQKVKLLGAILVAAGDVNLTIKSGAGTSLSGAIPLAAKGNGFVIPVSPLGFHLFETVAGSALVFNLSAAVAVTGAIAYVQEA